MEVILVEKIKSFLPEGAESKECLDIFSAPLKPSETLKQRLALLRLAVEYTQNKISKQELDDKLKSHHGEFSWLNMLGLRGKPYDFEFFRGQFDEAVAEGPERELDNLLKIQSSHDEKINQKLQELSASEELKKQVHSLRKLIYLRTWRLERISLGNFYIRPFLEAMAKRFNYTYDELIFLLPDEISRSLNGESIDKQVVHERQKSWGIIFDNDEIKFLQGKETDEYKDKVMVKTHGREIAGQTANKGFYRGVVKIIKRKKELDKIKKGDILVTEMTTPDFVPAMKNSGAIITDIGGITSHAAIVSRELGKPCIIATGNATKVLKDGDEVEVDADKGVVRKIGK
ncbi:hypothetical protein KJ969_01675 [Patescibacteria group bacterium]|nr:hypothetical protein [Patescibacteria group bacterium]MBU1922118.1 hypothetical protein [Patescibacteria group bacterium]